MHPELRQVKNRFTQTLRSHQFNDLPRFLYLQNGGSRLLSRVMSNKRINLYITREVLVPTLLALLIFTFLLLMGRIPRLAELIINKGFLCLTSCYSSFTSCQVFSASLSPYHFCWEFCLRSGAFLLTVNLLRSRHQVSASMPCSNQYCYWQSCLLWGIST